MFILENVKHIRKHIENTSSKIVQYISFRLFLCNKNNYHLLFKWTWRSRIHWKTLGGTAARCDSLLKTAGAAMMLGSLLESTGGAQGHQEPGSEVPTGRRSGGAGSGAGGRISAWSLFPLCNRNPPDPEPKRGVGRGVRRKVKGSVRVTFPGWVWLEPQVLASSWNEGWSFTLAGGSDLASLERTVPFLIARQPQTSSCVNSVEYGFS